MYNKDDKTVVFKHVKTDRDTNLDISYTRRAPAAPL